MLLSSLLYVHLYFPHSRRVLPVNGDFLLVVQFYIRAQLIPRNNARPQRSDLEPHERNFRSWIP